jgi:hypothetical protein
MIMKRNVIIMTSVFLVSAVLFGLVVILSTGVSAQDIVERGKPTFVPPRDLTPAPTPADGREIAILTLRLESQGGSERPPGVRLESGRILNSYAPNVLNRPGEWTVEVIGESELRYGIQDPRHLHVYGGQQREDTAHSTEFQDMMTLELVVPLYNLDTNLNAREIRILDQNQNVIFETEIDREGWKRE